MKVKLIISTICITIIFSILVVVYDLINYFNKPINANTFPITLTITSGQTFDSLCNNLYDIGLINRPWKLKLIARLKKKDIKIKAGEYRIYPNMSPKNILDVITTGKVVLHKFTVPEGYNIYQIAQLIEQKNFGTKIKFLELTTDLKFIKDQGIHAISFEGYLFPDTYLFSGNITEKKIIRTMVKRFHSIIKPEWKQRAKQLNMSMHQIIILASIIEKETGIATERELISSVFHNRLKKNMRLETDPTVIYGIKDFNGNITKKDLRSYTPYNTYMIKGLPSGPISNPGIASIKAALYPDDTNFLYFVSKNNKTHYFSTNLKQHNRAVRKYQLKR